MERSMWDTFLELQVKRPTRVWTWDVRSGAVVHSFGHQCNIDSIEKHSYGNTAMERLKRLDYKET